MDFILCLVVHVYIYIYLYLFFVHVHMCSGVHANTCMYSFVYVLCVYMNKCMYVYCVCMCAYIICMHVNVLYEWVGIFMHCVYVCSFAPFF